MTEWMTAGLRSSVDLFGVPIEECWDPPAGDKCVNHTNASAAPNLLLRLSKIRLRDLSLCILCISAELGPAASDLVSAMCTCAHLQVSLTKKESRSV